MTPEPLFTSLIASEPCGSNGRLTNGRLDQPQSLSDSVKHNSPQPHRPMWEKKCVRGIKPLLCKSLKFYLFLLQQLLNLNLINIPMFS